MGLWSSFTKSITALWSGPCSQSRHEDKVVEVKSRAPVKPEAPASDNPHSDPLPHSPEPPSTATLPQTPQDQNQDSTSDTKIFSPELMVAKAPELLTSKQAEKSSSYKYSSEYSEIDKLALCKRIIQSNLPKEKKRKLMNFLEILQQIL